MNNIVVTEPTIEPVTVNELRDHLRLDTTVDDSTLTTLIIASRQYVEQELRKALITQTQRLTLDRFPLKDSLGWWDGVKDGSLSQQNTDFIELPIGPLQSITSIKSWSVSETQSIFDSDKYYADTNYVPGRVILKTDETWPNDLREHSAIEIDYVCGYGDTVDKVPASIRQIIKIIASDWYENRNSVIIGTISANISSIVSDVLEKYKEKRL